MTDTRDDKEFAHFEYIVGPGERAAFANGRASRDAEVATLSRQLAEAQGVIERQKRVIDWVESWVSHPVGSYSVLALDGLFGMTRDKIAAQTAAYRTDDGAPKPEGETNGPR